MANAPRSVSKFALLAALGIFIAPLAFAADQNFFDLSGNAPISVSSPDRVINNVITGSTYTGTISGNGTLVIQGNGTWIVTGDTTNIHIAEIKSGVTVRGDIGGAFNVGGSLTIDSGAELQAVSDLDNVINNGTLSFAPGTNTLSIDSIGGNGVMKANLNSGGPTVSSKFFTADADIGGMKLVYTFSGVTGFHRGQSFTVLSTFLLNGRFNNLPDGTIVTATSTGANNETANNIANSLSPSMQVETNYVFDSSGHRVIATIINVDMFTGAGNTPNEKNLANILDPIASNSTGDTSTLLNALGGSMQVNRDLNSLTGELNTTLQQGNMQAMHEFTGMIGKRLGGDCNTDDNLIGNTKQRVKAGNTGSAANSASWACAYGSFGRVSSSVGAVGISSTLSGGAVGVETQPTSNSTLRFGLGYSHNDTSLASGTPNSASTNGAQIGVYGQYNMYSDSNGHAYVGGSVSGGYNFTNTKRMITAGGLTRQAQALPESFNLGASALLGYLTKVDRVNIEPVAGLEYQVNNQNGYDETGAGAANLSVDGKTTHTLRGSFGAQLYSSFTLDNGQVLVPQAHAAFIYDAFDVAPNVTENFAGSSFTVAGANPGRVGVQAGGGFTAHLDDQISIFADYNGTFKERETDHSILGGMKMNW